MFLCVRGLTESERVGAEGGLGFVNFGLVASGSETDREEFARVVPL